MFRANLSVDHGDVQDTPSPLLKYTQCLDVTLIKVTIFYPFKVIIRQILTLLHFTGLFLISETLNKLNKLYLFIY